MKRLNLKTLASLFLFLLAASRAHAVIYQWTYVDPSDPSQGVVQSTTLCPGGSGVFAAPNTGIGVYGLTDLTQAYLFNANLTDATLDVVNLTNANLSNANLTGCLLYANLTNANLSNVNLTNATLMGFVPNGINLANANLTGAIVTGAAIYDPTAAQLYSTASYQAKNLKGITLVGNLAGWDFSGQNLTNATFPLNDAGNGNVPIAVLTSANLSGATVTGVNFSGAEVTAGQLYSTASYQVKELSGINLQGYDLMGWDFSSQDLTGGTFGSGLHPSVLSNVNFANANLTDVNLSYGTLTSANLTGAIVYGANFTGSNLTAAQLYSTGCYQAKNLQGIMLPNYNLTGWNFSGQNLSNANLAGGTLTNVNLTGAVVTGGTLGGLTAAQLYSTASYQTKNLQGVYLDGDMTGWNFAGQNLTNAYLNGDLTNANFTGAIVTGANLVLANLTSAQFYSTGSYEAKNLQGIALDGNDLTGWNFSGQNLSNANLSGSTLTSANLTGAIVYGASFSAANLTAAQLYSTESYQAKNLQGINLPNYNLTRWNFSGQNLSNAILGGGTLTNANLTGAAVTGTNFQNSNLTASQLYSTASYQAHNLTGIGLALIDMTGWDLHGQTLIGANLGGGTLTNANLANANLTNADLDGTTLTNANLTDANLANVDLADATLTGANLTGADLANASVNYRYTDSMLYLANAKMTAADLRGAGIPLVLDPTVNITNAILPDGTIRGLNLNATNPTLVVRNYAGNVPIHIQQGMTMTQGSSLVLAFDGNPWGSTISFDPGIPVTLGGNLELGVGPGVNPATLIGQSIQVFNWSGVTPSGQFNFVNDVAGTCLFDVSQLYNSGNINVLGHAAPSLSVASGNNQTVIVGAAGITAGLTLSNGQAGQAGLAALDVNSLGAQVTGPTGSKLVASGSSQSYTATLSTGTVGTQVQNFSVTAGDDHTLVGVSPATSVSAGVTLTVLDHSAGAFVGGGTTLNLDFGTLLLGSPTQSLQYQIQNLLAPYRAAMDLDSVTIASNAQGAFGNNAAPFANLPSGSASNPMSVDLSTATTGAFSGQYLLNVSDEKDLPGHAGQAVLTLNVSGNISPNMTSVSGGTGVVGGVQSVFNSLVTPGILTSSFEEPTTPSALQQALGAEAAGQVNFVLAGGNTPQLWDMSFNGQFSGDATVTVHFDPSLLGSLPLSDLYIEHYENGSWVIPPNQVIDPINDTITFSSDGFSPYALAAVPEPGTLALLAASAIAAFSAWLRRRTGRNQ
jgi:uncharacterized protein YjbI with pentapeptide repeats